MKVFVTGASGYIGEAVAKAFRARGHAVMGLVRKEADAVHLRKFEIEPIMGSLAEIESLKEKLKDIQTFAHCAFEMSSKGISLDLKTIEFFIEFTKSFQLPRQLIYTSGCWVYGSTFGNFVDESSALNPIDLVKWRPSHEQKVLQSASEWLKTIVIRPSCVYGGRGGLTSLWFESIAKGEPLMAGNGKQRWSMIHVEDLAQMYVLSAEKELGPIVLNASDDASHRIEDCFLAIYDSLPVKKEIKRLNEQESLDRFGVLSQGLLVDQCISNERAKRLLGWYPKHIDFIQDAKIYYEAWRSFKD